MYILYEELVLALKSCKNALEISGIHGYMVKTGLNHDPFALSKLLAASILDTQYAASIFKHIECPNLYMYNTLIRSYSISDRPRQAFGVFNALRSKDILLDQFSFVTTLKACSSALDVYTGQTIHGLALRSGHVSFINVKNSLLNVYGVCGRILDAHKLFDENSPPNDLVSWNILMGAYLNASIPEEAVKIFRHLKHSNTDFGITAILCALHAYSDVGYSLGVEALHGQCIRNGLISDLNLVTAVIDRYGKVGKIDSGRQMFDSIADKDVILWNCMIDKYAKAGLLEESLALVQSMKHAQVKPNSATLVGLISACAAFEATDIGYSVNGFIEEEGLPLNVVLGTALVDMYVKFGFLDHAISIFDRMESKDIKSWTAMISGYGAHGHARDSVSLFCLMEEEGVRPNKVTFLSVLNACSHAGLVEEGTLFFKKMVQEYGLLPEIEHYGCLVDLFGRAGLLEDAHNLIMSLPIKGDATSWRALLSACRMYGNVKLGECVRAALIGLENHPTDSLLLSSTYATAGSLQDQIRMQEMEDKFSRLGRKNQTMVKEAGYSKIRADSGCC